jgi:3-oxoacyl-[acyl-carrier-protein] synthase II
MTVSQQSAAPLRWVWLEFSGGSMRKEIVITGMGCISPLGNSLPGLWESLMAGRSGVRLISHYDASEFKSRIAAEVKDFDAAALFGGREARKMDRFTQFAVAAAQQAVQHARLEITGANRDRIGAVVGSGIGGLSTLFEQMQVFIERGPSRVSPFLVPMMLPDSAGGMIAIQLGIRGPNMAVITACATGTNAVGEAAEMINRGAADIVLAGGSEASINPIAMAGLASMTALSTRNDDPQGASRPFDHERDGFVMGEGAGILVLESLESARARGAAILAEVVGYGCTNDAHHISAPSENGSGAAQCMRLALESAGLDPGSISYINAHGTSTHLNDRSETAAIKNVFGEQAYHVPISSTKSMTGHLLGASGAVEAIICTLALQQQLMPPTINYTNPDPDCDLDYVPNKPRPGQLEYVMSNSFGFGGHNATIILKRAAREAV